MSLLSPFSVFPMNGEPKTSPPPPVTSHLRGSFCSTEMVGRVILHVCTPGWSTRSDTYWKKKRKRKIFSFEYVKWSLSSGIQPQTIFRLKEAGTVGNCTLIYYPEYTLFREVLESAGQSAIVFQLTRLTENLPGVFGRVDWLTYRAHANACRRAVERRCGRKASLARRQLMRNHGKCW